MLICFNLFLFITIVIGDYNRCLFGILIILLKDNIFIDCVTWVRIFAFINCTIDHGNKLDIVIYYLVPIITRAINNLTYSSCKFNTGNRESYLRIVYAFVIGYYNSSHEKTKHMKYNTKTNCIKREDILLYSSFLKLYKALTPKNNIENEW